MVRRRRRKKEEGLAAVAARRITTDLFDELFWDKRRRRLRRRHIFPDRADNKRNAVRHRCHPGSENTGRGVDVDDLQHCHLPTGTRRGIRGRIRELLPEGGPLRIAGGGEKRRGGIHGGPATDNRNDVAGGGGSARRRRDGADVLREEDAIGNHSEGQVHLL